MVNEHRQINTIQKLAKVVSRSARQAVNGFVKRLTKSKLTSKKQAKINCSVKIGESHLSCGVGAVEMIALVKLDR